MFIPSYIEAHRTGKLAESIGKAYKILENCRLCPRECGINRLKDEKGICRTGRLAGSQAAILISEKRTRWWGRAGQGPYL